MDATVDDEMVPPVEDGPSVEVNSMFDDPIEPVDDEPLLWWNLQLKAWSWLKLLNRPLRTLVTHPVMALNPTSLWPQPRQIPCFQWPG